MRRLFITTTALAGLALAGAGWAYAEAPSKPNDAHQMEAPAKAAPGGMGAMGGMGKTGGGMGSMGMMEHEGMCPMMMGGMGGGMGAMMGMGGADTQIAVKNTAKGVTITLTASDPAKVARLQKMAEAMRLMHEATAP
jgi:hypothetical protein